MSAGKKFMVHWTNTGFADEELRSKIDELVLSNKIQFAVYQRRAADCVVGLIITSNCYRLDNFDEHKYPHFNELGLNESYVDFMRSNVDIAYKYVTDPEQRYSEPYEVGIMPNECKSDLASQREAFKKIRIRRNTNNVKKDISSYLKWCKISGLKAEDERSLNLYIELTTLIMEQIDDPLQNTNVAE